MATIASPAPRVVATQQQTARMPIRPLRVSHNAATSSKRSSPLARVTTAEQGAPLTALRPNEDEDSSDDESSAAPVLSAAAEELLGERMSDPKPASTAKRASYARNYAEYAGGSPLGKDEMMGQRKVRYAIATATAEPPAVLRQRSASPVSSQEARTESQSPRVVKLSNGSPGSAMLRRTRSTNSTGGSPVQREIGNYKTPAPRPKSYIGNSSGSPVASDRQESGEPRSGYHSSGRTLAYTGSGGADVREGLQQGTATRDHIHGSIRIKRIGQGTFLRGPARRGMIRRQTDEEQSPLSRNNPDGDVEYGSGRRGGDLQHSPAEDPLPTRIRHTETEQQGTVEHQPEQHASSSHQESPMLDRYAKVPAQPPSTGTGTRMPPQNSAREQAPSHSDKENQIPTSVKHEVPPSANVLHQPLSKPAVTSIKKADHDSPPRPVLAPKSTNTPLRPAPPPPKMNVVDTATAAAGAMASQKRKKQTIANMTVNGRRFTRLDCIGRGGSGKVFRVMAENYKLYALKRVSLEGMDEMAIRGFKGEINLLQQLKDVDRVVRLIDYEVNNERQQLTVLMEMGELDLKKIVDPHIDEQTGRFDVTFTRYIWREMLECVRSVHEHDVVHSDLKPANFVMAQGRLKLIDFGIANAIADDTVNVHREQTIGTPNYMSPEALVDTNAGPGRGGMLGPSAGKLMKLGKPSDVWSLGCILYQIVYGKPPFGHIQATHSKVCAIVSNEHPITFPSKGLGDMPVPLGLVRTLKRCLNRDQKARPTVEELLGERDPFLHPDADGLIPLSEELLGLIQRKVVGIIKQRGSAPDDGELAIWQSNMFENVRNAIRDGKINV